METLIALLVIGVLVAVGVLGYRTFAPELERARRIRRANRGGGVQR